MRYVLIETVKIGNVTYPEGTECVRASSAQVPKRFHIMKRIAERVESGMDQKHLVVYLEGEIRIIRKKQAEPVYTESGSDLPMRL